MSRISKIRITLLAVMAWVGLVSFLPGEDIWLNTLVATGIVVATLFAGLYWLKKSTVDWTNPTGKIFICWIMEKDHLRISLKRGDGRYKSFVFQKENTRLVMNEKGLMVLKKPGVRLAIQECSLVNDFCRAE